jgi:hypothetical protein
MNILNVAKHILSLTEHDFGSEEQTTTTADEMSASRMLFKVLKDFKDSYLNELFSYDTLDFDDEFDEISEEEESSEETDEYDEIQDRDVRDYFTLEEMEMIVDWVDQHPNYTISSIKNRFRKVKSMLYIQRFRKYIDQNGTRVDKLNKIKEFMLNEFHLKRTIEKEAVHDADLQLFAVQKARELEWDRFVASESFVTTFKKQNRISSRRYNKLVSRSTNTRKACSREGN